MYEKIIKDSASKTNIFLFIFLGNIYVKPTIILVEPEYDRNIGYICRVMANFGFKRLVIINPKCALGPDAVKYSKHAISILKNAKKASSFENEAKKYDFIVGTTGIIKRNKDAIRDIIPFREFIEKYETRNKKCAIVLGREGIGLMANEINLCDILITIESDKKYPILNISHALGIILYGITKNKIKIPEESASKKEKEQIITLFSIMAKKSKNPKLSIASMRRIIGKAKIKHLEAIRLIEVLRENMAD